MDRKALADCIMFGSGIFLMGYAAFILGQILRLRRWPSVPAEILGGQLAWDFTQMHAYRKLRIRYSYVVQGQKFEGDRITVADGLLAGGELLIRSIVKTHILPGARAYYDPRQPSQALLVRPGFGLPIASALVGVGIAVFWMVFRHTY